MNSFLKIVSVVLFLFAVVLVCNVVPLGDLIASAVAESPEEIAASESAADWQGAMAGEITESSVVLQARIGGYEKTLFSAPRDMTAAFAVSKRKNFKEPMITEWMRPKEESDYIVKTEVNGLEPGTRYYYRLLSGDDRKSLSAGPAGAFRTLDPANAYETRFTVVTGMNRFAFKYNSRVKNKKLGFPGLDTIRERNPHFMVFTGDNVYYDTPFVGRDKDRQSMRDSWHLQFERPRFEKFFLEVPGYWMKDDHDYRYNDADPYGDIPPSHELGVGVFLEQVPLGVVEGDGPLTYRTYRVSKDLQIWLLEGRDYRDKNTMPPTSEKSMWGQKQRTWLKRTLQESDATFKIMISPTPLVGPDDAMTGVQMGILSYLIGGKPLGQGDDPRKRDNHVNAYGFKPEADRFFAWLKNHGFLEKNFYIVCGDRHWQYHSVHPSGFEEFSCGALVDGNSRLGIKPGTPGSTDPEAKIKQPYLQPEASGGFLEVSVKPAAKACRTVLTFDFYDEKGNLLYSENKKARCAFKRDCGKCD